MNYKLIKECRSCKSKNLVFLFCIGNLYFTGIFPKKKNIEKVPRGKLTLLLCKNCSLVQLDRNFNSKIMYGNNYGYRSGLNLSMINHLKEKYKKIKSIINIKKGDTILDIGANDGTFLKNFSHLHNLIAIDPTISKFYKFYRKGIKRSKNFFSEKNFKNISQGKKAKIITSIAMFYDLEDPINFAIEIYNCLSDDGIWHFEQSYLPLMLKSLSYDTICHEHLEYYSLKSILYILDKANFKIVDIEINEINGGSIAITAAKKKSIYIEKINYIKKLLKSEEKDKLYTSNTYKVFFKKIQKSKINLVNFIKVLIKKKENNWVWCFNKGECDTTIL